VGLPFRKPVVKVAQEGTSRQSDAMREAAASNEGWESTINAGKAIALTAWDLLNDREKGQQIRDESKDRHGK
jgi:hypothetical protein